MPEQVLRIEPEHELKFKGPFNIPSTTALKLTNPSDKRVCFKIKTTAPKRYCVRPNAGLLLPGQSNSIAVVFQPCELEPTANKHKFMVQALYAADGDAPVDMDTLWKEMDSTKLMDTKLRCTFEIPADSGNQNDLNASDDVKVTRAKNDDVFAKSPKGGVGDETTMLADELVSTTYDFAENADHAASFMTCHSDDNHGVGDASARVSVQQADVQLRQENGQLKDEIDRLRRQLKSREYSSNSGPSMSMQSASPPAIPMVYIVLALAAVLIGLVLGKFIL